MNVKEHLRVAVIGAGAMATRVHYPSLASFDDVTVAAACDLDQGRLGAVADQYGIQGRYTDYRRMVEEVAPDAVYAIGQPHQLYDAWLWCLQRGVNLYIEKPLGLSLHQAEILRYLAEQNGCITQVSFQRRTTPMVVQHPGELPAPHDAHGGAAAGGLPRARADRPRGLQVL
jgi:virulence factor